MLTQTPTQQRAFSLLVFCTHGCTKSETLPYSLADFTRQLIFSLFGLMAQFNISGFRSWLGNLLVYQIFGHSRYSSEHPSSSARSISTTAA